MHYINRLPLLFALFAAILSGITGISRSTANDRILLQMIITMVVFYVVGLFVRYNLSGIYNQMKEKKEKEKEAEQENEEPEQEINISVEEKDNIIDFEPLKVSKFIKEELRKSNN